MSASSTSRATNLVVSKITIAILGAVLLVTAYFVVRYKIDGVRAREKHKAYQALHHFYQEQLKQAGTSPVVIIGDSHVQSLLAQNIVPGAINLGIGGDTIQGVTARLGDYLHIAPDSTVIVLVGTNNLLGEDLTQSLERLPELAALISDQPAVFWVAAPGAAEARIPAGKISQFNDSVRKNCASIANCRFIPGTDENFGRAPLLRPDGIHLTTIGYEYLTSQIRKDIIAGNAVMPDQATQEQVTREQATTDLATPERGMPDQGEPLAPQNL